MERTIEILSFVVIAAFSLGAAYAEAPDFPQIAHRELVTGEKMLKEAGTLINAEEKDPGRIQLMIIRVKRQAAEIESLKKSAQQEGNEALEEELGEQHAELLETLESLTSILPRKPRRDNRMTDPYRNRGRIDNFDPWRKGWSR